MYSSSTSYAWQNCTNIKHFFCEQIEIIYSKLAMGRQEFNSKNKFQKIQKVKWDEIKNTRKSEKHKMQRHTKDQGTLQKKQDDNIDWLLRQFHLYRLNEHKHKNNQLTEHRCGGKQDWEQN